jgi:hypothetical protein
MPKRPNHFRPAGRRAAREVSSPRRLQSRPAVKALQATEIEPERNCRSAQRPWRQDASGSQLLAHDEVRRVPARLS